MNRILTKPNRTCAFAFALSLAGPLNAAGAKAQAMSPTLIDEFVSACVMQGGRVANEIQNVSRRAAVNCKLPSGDTRSCVYDDRSDACRGAPERQQVLWHGAQPLAAGNRDSGVAGP